MEQELVDALAHIVNRCNSMAEADTKGLLLSIREEAERALKDYDQSARLRVTLQEGDVFTITLKDGTVKTEMRHE